MTEEENYTSMLELSKYLKDVIYSDKTYECIINQFGQKCHLVSQDKLARSHIGTKTMQELAHNTLENLKKEIDELVIMIEKLNRVHFSSENNDTSHIEEIKNEIVQKGYNGMKHVVSFVFCIEECKGTYGRYTPEESGLKKATNLYLRDIGLDFFKIKSYIKEKV